MKVCLTQTAEDCLWVIWNHDCLYSEALAAAFQRDIDRFIRDAIGGNPEIGHVWHAPRGIRRLIFRRRYNIFYALRDDVAFILFVTSRVIVDPLLEQLGSLSLPVLECVEGRSAL